MSSALANLTHPSNRVYLLSSEGSSPDSLELPEVFVAPEPPELSDVIPVKRQVPATGAERTVAGTRLRRVLQAGCRSTNS